MRDKMSEYMSDRMLKYSSTSFHNIYHGGDHSKKALSEGVAVYDPFCI
jgi:hypothetical protein